MQNLETTICLYWCYNNADKNKPTKQPKSWGFRDVGEVFKVKDVNNWSSVIQFYCFNVAHGNLQTEYNNTNFFV